MFTFIWHCYSTVQAGTPMTVTEEEPLRAPAQGPLVKVRPAPTGLCLAQTIDPHDQPWRALTSAIRWERSRTLASFAHCPVLFRARGRAARQKRLAFVQGVMCRWPSHGPKRRALSFLSCNSPATHRAEECAERTFRRSSSVSKYPQGVRGQNAPAYRANPSTKPFYGLAVK